MVDGKALLGWWRNDRAGAVAITVRRRGAARIGQRAMVQRESYKQLRSFFISIILPSLLAVLLLIGSIYVVIIPAFERSFIDSKQGMIRELTNVAWSVLALYQHQEEQGLLTRQEAEQRALTELRNLRYGDEKKDYFWVTDMHPRMLMHPYAVELNGLDLTFYRDSGGKHLFVEMKKIALASGSGFVEYMWQAKDDATRIVPKLSYVKHHEPWGWIVGTGVYLDDVRLKTEEISNRLEKMVIFITVLVAILLFFTLCESYVIERKKHRVEKELKHSLARYKLLVETASDGILTVFEGRYLYSNKTFQSMLGYPEEILTEMDLFALFSQSHDDMANSVSYFQSMVDGEISSEQHGARLRRRDGSLIDVILTFTKMTLGEQTAVVMTAKDDSMGKKIEEQLGESREKYRLLTEQLNIGVFRTGAKNGFRFQEANRATVDLLGMKDQDELLRSSLADAFKDSDEAEDIHRVLMREGFIKDRMVRMQHPSGMHHVVSLSMVVSHGEKGQPLFCDGIIEDITKETRTEEERENLIVELQTSLMFLNQSIQNVMGDFVACDLTTSIQHAARIMSKTGHSAILVSSEGRTMIGIVTDMALRQRVVAEDISLHTPVVEVMSSPLIFIDESALLFEAILLMREKRVKHLVVRNSEEQVVSVITNEEILHLHQCSASFMIQEIQKAQKVDALVESQKRLPRIIKALTDSGAHARNITRIITSVSDGVVEKLLELAIAQKGKPPASFAFVSLGSEGRGEQTLVTDQDNAIIFDDVAPEELERVQTYFLELGTLVCGWLDAVGYHFCKGEVMAMTPRWCQPLKRWKGYFSEWAATANPQDLLEVSIFFDFRTVYGDQTFTDQLREHIEAETASNAAFFQHLATNALLCKVPLDFFGNFSLETAGEYSGCFSLKGALSAVVGCVQIYSIRHGLESTNTLERLSLLYEKNIINKATYQEVAEGYNYLMQMRFKHQIENIDRGELPDNYINPAELSHMERSMLKKIFSQIASFHKHISYEFTGVA